MSEEEIQELVEELKGVQMTPQDRIQFNHLCQRLDDLDRDDLDRLKELEYEYL